MSGTILPPRIPSLPIDFTSTEDDEGKIKKNLAKRQSQLAILGSPIPYYHQTRFPHDVAIGFGAGALSKFVMVPFDRIRMLADNPDFSSSRQFTSHVLRLVKEDGPGFLFRRSVQSSRTWMSAFYTGLTFGTYTLLVRLLNMTFEEDGGKYLVSKFWCGAVASFGSLLVSHPIDEVRIRVSEDKFLVEQGKRASRHYRSTPHGAVKILSSEGIFQGYYRGFTKSTFGVGMYRSTYFGLYELMKAWNHDWIQESDGRTFLSNQSHGYTFARNLLFGTITSTAVNFLITMNAPMLFEMPTMAQHVSHTCPSAGGRWMMAPTDAGLVGRAVPPSWFLLRGFQGGLCLALFDHALRSYAETKI